MLITALGKIRIIAWCSTWCGELSPTSTPPSLSPFLYVVGHTKFAPDWCFGLFKRHYHWTKVGSLKTISQAVNDSADCNFAQLVCNESGATIVPTYDWTDFFAPHLKKVASIKKYHHFRCDSSQPGVVFVKQHADTDEEKINLMKCSPPWLPDPNNLPSLVPPKGLSAERQWTFMRASARFVQTVTRTPLALCLMFQG